MSISRTRFSGARASRRPFDPIILIPILAVSYSVIIQPLIYFLYPPPPGLEGLLQSRLENRIFWPILAGVAVLLCLRDRAKFNRVVLPPNIVSLIFYFAFAVVSVAWAFNPELTFIRSLQEAMILTSIILPALIVPRTVDLMHYVFLCFGLAAAVNVLLIPGGYTTVASENGRMMEIGYQGYFTGKNLLGEFSAIALLLSAHEMLYRGKRRILGLAVAALAVALLFLSSSKTAFALAFLSPILAVALLSARRFGASPAVIMSLIAFAGVVLCKGFDFDPGRIAYIMTGDSSFTGRTVLWAFADMEIARSPLLGWGYQSFWLAGPDAPSVVDAPGWVKYMPNAHSGYYDTLLELGYIGLTLLAVFLVANLYVIGQVAKRDAKKAWLLLSIALFAMLYNFLETLWMRAFDLLWVVFLVVAVEAARQWQPVRSKAASQSRDDEEQMSPPRHAWKPRFGART